MLISGNNKFANVLTVIMRIALDVSKFAVQVQQSSKILEPVLNIQK